MIYNLTISKQVISGTEEYIEYAPPQGKIITVSFFIGNAPSSINSVVKLIWKYGSGSEQILWTIKGGESYSVPTRLPIQDVDGINKLAVVLENAESADIYMSGSAIIEVEDVI